MNFLFAIHNKLKSATTNEIMDLLTGINNAGNTIIIVTHEDDIAVRTKRTINLMDGNIESDVRN